MDRSQPDRNRKRQIGQPAAVEMAQLPPSDAELDCPIAVRRDAHAVPRADLFHDAFVSRSRHTSIVALLPYNDAPLPMKAT